MAKAKSGFENFFSSVWRVISYPFRLIGSAFKGFVNWILPNTFKDEVVEPAEQEAPAIPAKVNSSIAQNPNARTPGQSYPLVTPPHSPDFGSIRSGQSSPTASSLGDVQPPPGAAPAADLLRTPPRVPSAPASPVLPAAKPLENSSFNAGSTPRVPPVVMRVGGSDSQPMSKSEDPHGVLTVPVTHPQHCMPPDPSKYPQEVFNPDPVELEKIPKDLRQYLGDERLYQAMMKQYIMLLAKENRNLFFTANPRRAASFYTLDAAPVPDNIAKAEVPINQQVFEDFQDAKTDPSKTLFAYPVRLSESHWVLLVIDRQHRTVEYYDSLRDFNKNQVQAHFNTLAEKLTEIDPGKIPYKADFKIKTRIQNDGFNCGAWALYFLQHRVFNKQIDFNNLPYIPQMKNYRKVLVETLVRGSISKPDSKLLP